MDRLLDCLINRIHRQTKQRAEAPSLRRTQMRDVVDSVPMQANGLDEIDLYFVPGSNSADEVFPSPLHGLCDRKNGRDVVSGMGIVRSEKRVVHVQFADRRAVRPGRPLRTETLSRRHAEYGCAVVARMAQSHCPCCNDRAAIDCGNRHTRIIDDAIDDEFSYIRLSRDNIGGDTGNFPSELFFARKSCFGRMDFYSMDLHFRFYQRFVARRRRGTFSPQRHLPHLRRLASFYFVYPVLPHRATIFRASGAASQLTNQKRLTTSCKLRVARYHGMIPNRPQQSRRSPATNPERRRRDRT